MKASEALTEMFLKDKAIMVAGSADHQTMSGLRANQGAHLNRIARGFLRAQKRGKIRETTSPERAEQETKVGMGLLASFFLSALVKALIAEFVRWALMKMDVVRSCSAGFPED